MNCLIFCDGVTSSWAQSFSKVAFFLGSTSRVNLAVRFSILMTLGRDLGGTRVNRTFD